MEEYFVTVIDQRIEIIIIFIWATFQNNPIIQIRVREVLLTGHTSIVRFEVFMCIRTRIAELQCGRNDAAVLLFVTPVFGRFGSHLTKRSWYTLTTCTVMDPVLPFLSFLQLG